MQCLALRLDGRRNEPKVTLKSSERFQCSACSGLSSGAPSLISYCLVPIHCDRQRHRQPPVIHTLFCDNSHSHHADPLILPPSSSSTSLRPTVCVRYAAGSSRRQRADSLVFTEGPIVSKITDAWAAIYRCVVDHFYTPS